MITQKPAASRLPLKAASTAFAALLALGLPLAAQSRGHSSGGGGGRSAHSTGGGSRSSSPGGAPSYSGGNNSGGSHSGGNSGGGRTAHEVPGGSSSSSAQRQPSGRGGGSHGHGGYHGGHYYGGGGYYGGYYGSGYPYGYFGGWGFWPGISWGYDPYYGYGYPYGHGYPGSTGRYYDSYERGALDLDVAPGRTHVFVDGEDLGPVDRYDGWPGYLWLPKGTYDVAFYLDGYKTVARQLTVYPGTVIDIDDRLEQGQSVRPEDLATKTHERRDERLSYERQRRESIRQYGDNHDDDDQDWRTRRDRDRGAMRHDSDDDDDDQNGRMEDRSSGGAHLRLSVEPDDASIYLDGQFVGTGTDVSLLKAGLPVAPGTHRLAVVRPGHKAVEKEFDVKAGGDVELDIELESGSGR